MSANFLATMREHALKRARESSRRKPLAQLMATVTPTIRGLDFDRSQLLVIAEFKRASPSEGTFAPAHGLNEQVERYARAGAGAISILTEPQYFKGEVRDLAALRAISPLPIMRKDFIVDPYQVIEARAAGADGVLLITAMLRDMELRDLISNARALGMFAIVEASCREDILRAIDVEADIIGINSRDLRSLDVDTSRFEELRHLIPVGVRAVAESGIRSPGDVRELAELEFDVVLVGTQFMKSDDPEALVRSFVQAGQRSETL